MVDKSNPRRRPGRPRAFVPEEALDRAVELFWAEGFDGVDVDRIAHAAGVTKPSLYRVFGDKSSLFLQAVHRYGETVGAAPLVAFRAHSDVARAVRALLEETIKAATMKGRASGCLVACVAIAQAGRSEEIRVLVAHGLATLTAALSRRFAEEIASGRLAAAPSAKTRSKMLVDLMQGLMLRARAGASRANLLRDARSYAQVVVR
jgi:AcrR family transcriptional regulator